MMIFFLDPLLCIIAGTGVDISVVTAGPRAGADVFREQHADV